ncbi:MAG: amino acid adenylation domain-containing protein, partial [Flavitalea sp.]
DNDIDKEFNIIGWNDSFAGGAIPAEQMKEWLQDIVKIIFSENPGNVLEIGCGTGLIYYQLAGKVKKYIGTDFSRSSINQINQWISIGHRDYGETELHVCAAHEITLKENQVVDTIIINSVVQYFPGEDYLNEVIKKSISVLNGKGRIIIGDVRDNRLLELFKCRLQLQKLQESLSIKEYKWIVDQEILKEEELCFSPEYFYNLQSWYPQITGVEIQWKQSSFINELTLYRYNVILHVGKEPAMFDPQWQHWSETNSNEIIEKLELGSATIAIKDVPNHRLWQEQLLSQNLVHRSEGTVGELVQALRIKDKDSVAIEQLLNFATARGYHYRLLLDEDPLKQNLLFEINPATGFIKQAYSDNGYTSTTQLTNIPLFTNIASLFQKEIRALLQQRLPDYMVPSEFITLGRLPLTSNGKIDRRFLSRREDKSVANKLNYEPPATELEQALASIWKELLGIDRVGIHDDFFELGGHSLLATRAVSAVRRRLNVELTIKDLFTHSTIAGLIEYFASQNRVVLPPIKVEPRTEFIPLSFSQERLWFIDRLEGSVQYHIPAVLRLKGSLDKKALLFSLQTIVNRHEVLRTVIREQDGHPSQVIKDKNQWNLVSVDGSQYRHHDTGLKQYIERVIREPFDLAKDFMLRATLVAIDEQEHILIVTMHHIASDGWSLSIIVKEIAELYEAAVHHRPPVLPTLHVQYADFAIWQRRYIQGELLDKKMNYWKEKLADVAALQIPTDYPRPAIQSSKGDVLAFIISKELLAKLNLLSQEHGVTLFMTLLSAFKVLMHQYTSQQDICVGTSIAGRQQEEIEGLIGFFINSLALRSEVKSTASFTELLQQVKVTTLEAYENQEVPFERVVDAVVKERDLSRNPLFQVLFALQNIPEVPNLSLGDIVLSQENFEHTTTQFDLTFRITETPSGLVSSVEYCTDLFHKQTIRRMLNHFEKLLDSIVTNPQQKIAELSILSKEEEDEILVAFNDTFSAYPKHLSLVGLFEEKAMAVPRNKAVVFGDLHLTYEELDKRSNQLAHHLISKGIIPGSNVGLMSMRKPEMIIGLFGILKAGCAYVPFNMEYPTERLNFIIEDAGITHVVLTDTNLIGSLCLDEHAFINIEESSYKSVEPVALKTGINARAYIMYTSGTTGTPKGIAVSHQNIIKLVYEQREIAVRTDDHVLQWSNYAFDGSTYEIYSSLLQGASLHLIKESAASDVFELSEIIKNQHITVSFVTTALFNTFIDVSPQSLIGLRKILFGGEMVSLSHVRKALSVLGTDKIIHVYGPTETTVYATYYCVNSIAGNGTIPIGRPLSNTQLYVLNNLQKLVPVGVAGELFIGGDGVSFGYLNKNALTTEKFVPDPFTNVGKLYKTGDRVRWLDDGTIEFLGRFDQQVKIRGYRIELGEIESVLQQSKLVRQAVVIAKEDKEGTKSLVAYVVPQADFDRDSITIYLKDKLPEYMVPSVWVELESLPLNSNGKVDKKVLPEPDASDLLVNEHVAPRTELEKKLAIIWQDLLDLETVGIHDNFFEIGGHSLLAIRLISVIRKELSTEVPISEIFEYPTIAELATSLNKPSEVVALPTIKAETRPELIPLSFSQERLWFIDQLEGSVQYHLPAVFKLKGRVDTTALEHTLKTIVNRHEVLRTVFRHQDGQPWQKIKEKDGWHLSVLDSFQTEPRQLIDRLIKEPFDLSKDHMLRASLIKLSEEEH